MYHWVAAVCIFFTCLATLKVFLHNCNETSGPTQEIKKQRQYNAILGQIILLLLIVSEVLIHIAPTPTSTQDSSWTWSDLSQISLTFIWGFAALLIECFFVSTIELAFNQDTFVETNVSIFNKLNLNISINIKYVPFSYFDTFTAMSLLLLQTIMGVALSYRKYVEWELHDRYYYYIAQTVLIIDYCEIVFQLYWTFLLPFRLYTLFTAIKSSNSHNYQRGKTMTKALAGLCFMAGISNIIFNIYCQILVRVLLKTLEMYELDNYNSVDYLTNAILNEQKSKVAECMDDMKSAMISCCFACAMHTLAIYFIIDFNFIATISSATKQSMTEKCLQCGTTCGYFCNRGGCCDCCKNNADDAQNDFSQSPHYDSHRKKHTDSTENNLDHDHNSNSEQEYDNENGNRHRNKRSRDRNSRNVDRDRKHRNRNRNRNDGAKLDPPHIEESSIEYGDSILVNDEINNVSESESDSDSDSDTEEDTNSLAVNPSMCDMNDDEVECYMYLEILSYLKPIEIFRNMTLISKQFNKIVEMMHQCYQYANVFCSKHYVFESFSKVEEYYEKRSNNINNNDQKQIDWERLSGEWVYGKVDNIDRKEMDVHVHVRSKMDGKTVHGINCYGQVAPAGTMSCRPGNTRKFVNILKHGYCNQTCDVNLKNVNFWIDDERYANIIYGFWNEDDIEFEMNDIWRCGWIDFNWTWNEAIDKNEQMFGETSDDLDEKEKRNEKILENSDKNGKFRIFQVRVNVDITEEYNKHDASIQRKIDEFFALEKKTVEDRFIISIVFHPDDIDNFTYFGSKTTLSQQSKIKNYLFNSKLASYNNGIVDESKRKLLHAVNYPNYCAVTPCEVFNAMCDSLEDAMNEIQMNIVNYNIDQMYCM